MAKLGRAEDEADIWLREHDPYYTDKRRGKRSALKYPYDTPQQERRRAETEIPISNLNQSQKVSIKCVAGCYDEVGEFNL